MNPFFIQNFRAVRWNRPQAVRKPAQKLRFCAKLARGMFHAFFRACQEKKILDPVPEGGVRGFCPAVRPPSSVSEEDVVPPPAGRLFSSRILHWHARRPHCPCKRCNSARGFPAPSARPAARRCRRSPQARSAFRWPGWHRCPARPAAVPRRRSGSPHRCGIGRWRHGLFCLRRRAVSGRRSGWRRRCSAVPRRR